MSGNRSAYWTLSHSSDASARKIADRHYNRQKIGSQRFLPPGRCVTLLSRDGQALWVTSWPYAIYVRHAWAGAWINSLFRNESSVLSSVLIRDALAVTRSIWPNPPSLGLVTFIDTEKTKRKRDPGRCYIRAGFSPAYCPMHAYLDLILPECAACQSRTKAGLVAVQMMPQEIPDGILPARSAIARKITRPIISE